MNFKLWLLEDDGMSRFTKQGRYADLDQHFSKLGYTPDQISKFYDMDDEDKSSWPTGVASKNPIAFQMPKNWFKQPQLPNEDRPFEHVSPEMKKLKRMISHLTFEDESPENEKYGTKQIFNTLFVDPIANSMVKQLFSKDFTLEDVKGVIEQLVNTKILKFNPLSMYNSGSQPHAPYVDNPTKNQPTQNYMTPSQLAKIPTSYGEPVAGNTPGPGAGNTPQSNYAPRSNSIPKTVNYRRPR